MFHRFWQLGSMAGAWQGIWGRGNRSNSRLASGYEAQSGAASGLILLHCLVRSAPAPAPPLSCVFLTHAADRRASRRQPGSALARRLHTHTHTPQAHKHPRTHTHTHTCTHTQDTATSMLTAPRKTLATILRQVTHTLTGTHTHTYMRSHTHTNTHACTQTHVHAPARAPARTCTHTHTRAHASYC